MAIKELNHINIRTRPDGGNEGISLSMWSDLKSGFRPPFDSHGYWLYCGDVPIVHLSLSDPDGDPRTIASGRGEGLDHIGLFAQDLVATEKTLAENEVTYKKCLAGGGRLVQVFLSRSKRCPGRTGL